MHVSGMLSFYFFRPAHVYEFTDAFFECEIAFLSISAAAAGWSAWEWFIKERGSDSERWGRIGMAGKGFGEEGELLGESAQQL